MIGKDVGYIRLYSFNQKSTDDVSKALEDLKAKGAKGFVFDVRDNPGGLLDQAVDVASLFIPSGVIVRVDERGKPEEQHRATGRVATDAPVVVLVNGDSASASEIVAGALQDYGRAVLIGDKTFGKGSVQLLHELSNGSELRVTVARWFTPKGRAIHGEGLDPDIVVGITQEDVDAERDPQLDRAVEYLLTGK
jgi:carboxyl-terminal processing protease